MAKRRPKLDEVVDYRLAEMHDVFTSGLSELTGRARREWEHGEGGQREYGDVVGRFGGVKSAFRELQYFKEGPARIAKAIEKGKGPLYDDLRATVAKAFEDDYPEARKRSRGRPTVRPHKHLRRYCVHCRTFHTKDEHRFHGKGSFHRTHLWGFPKNPADDRELLFPPGGFEQAEGASKPTLARDEKEAQRMLYAGRGAAALRKAKEFDRERLEKSPLFAPTRPSLFTNRRRPVNASRTFAELMATARRRALTAREKEQLTQARQALRRRRRPAMNRRKTSENKPARRFSVYVGAPDGSASKYFGDATTLLKAKKILQGYTRSHGYSGFIVGPGGEVVYTSGKRAPYTPLSPMRKNPRGKPKPKTREAVARRFKRMYDDWEKTGFRKGFREKKAKPNPAPVLKTRRRIGRIVELRYDRDTGGHQGFYKHTFTTNASVYILPGNKGILIR